MELLKLLIEELLNFLLLIIIIIVPVVIALLLVLTNRNANRIKELKYELDEFKLSQYDINKVLLDDAVYQVEN